MKGNISRPKRLDDFKYLEEPEMTALFMEKIAETKFHGVSVSNSFNLHCIYAGQWCPGEMVNGSLRMFANIRELPLTISPGRYHLSCLWGQSGKNEKSVKIPKPACASQYFWWGMEMRTSLLLYTSFSKIG